MNHRKTLSIMLISIMMMLSTASIFPTVAAGSPKAVLGTLYIDNGRGYEIAEDGIEVKIVIDGDTFDITTKLNETSQINYGIGIPPGYEAKTGYFHVYVGGNDLVPDDNKSVSIGSDNTYYRDLHITTSSGGDDDDDDNGGTGGGTGGGLPPPTNQPPTADATESQKTGFVGEPIDFDGSLSNDSDGTIDLYEWDWDNDGVYNYNSASSTATHTFNAAGTYSVTLRVTDNEEATDKDTIIVVISKANLPPTKPTVDGNTTGHKNADYDYTAVSTDADNDTIQYTFNWDDSSANTVTDFLSSGTTTTQTHSWTNPGIYELSVKAYDNGTESAATKLTVLIDVHWVKDIGYLIDDDSDGTYDTFYSNSTEEQTDVEKQDDGTYLLDDDGDGSWDWIYDIETDTLTEYNEPTTDDYTLLIILIIVIILILIIVGYLLKRKKDEE